MRRVAFDPSRLSGDEAEWWEHWEELAADARDELKRNHTADGELEFNAAIWRRLKEWLYQRVFGRRCAYCEGKSGGQAFPRGEHWRPKGPGAEDQHPGYWWLAYEWTNLLPSCERCNNVKGARFPVEGQRVFEQGDATTVEALDALERPLLLHPLRNEDPEDHLGFDEFGGIYAKGESPLGKETIRVLGLDRGDLVEERFDAITATLDAVNNAAFAAMAADTSYEEAVGDRLESTPFPSAVLPVAEQRRIQHMERFRPRVG